MNGLSEYSSALIADLMRVWRSKVEVTVGHGGGEGIYIDTGASKSILFYSFVC